MNPRMSLVSASKYRIKRTRAGGLNYWRARIGTISNRARMEVALMQVLRRVAAGQSRSNCTLIEGYAAMTERPYFWTGLSENSLMTTKLALKLEIAPMV